MTQRRSLITLMILVLIAGTASTGCAVVQQDQVGVKRTFGKLQDRTLDPGLYFVNPFATRMLRLPVRTQNIEVRLDLPSAEGLTVASEISILYRVDAQKAHEVLSYAGPNYEEEIILSIFRSAAADVCAKFMAKDMHSGERSDIEQAIKERMMSMLADRGFEIEAVLLKSIKLPTGLSRSIEARMSAEQDSMRMKFILEQERQEAERKQIEARGERDAQRILAEGLSEEVLRWRAIEAFLLLSTSPNAKVVITNTNTPMLLGPEGGNVDIPTTGPVDIDDQKPTEEPGTRQ